MTNHRNVARRVAIRFALAVLAFPAAQARAEDRFQTCALNGWETCAPKGYEACALIASQACTLKPETRICSPDGGHCWYIGIDNFVAVRRVEGGRIHVMTEGGPAVAPLNALVMPSSE